MSQISEDIEELERGIIDNLTGENVFADNATGYQDMCYQPTVERGIPFSSTHGNVSRDCRTLVDRI